MKDDSSRASWIEQGKKWLASYEVKPKQAKRTCEYSRKAGLEECRDDPTGIACMKAYIEVLEARQLSHEEFWGR